ncbi:hypothetical protein [Psychroserpens jangbogonensis]|uniref:hypothetical protein n=1 Tax=Psychroserpens jangbogonensis TaxID=1484460 RepID=UPI00053D2CF4|nr:hypothetical protein [Psychroserpens jangbogonensis]
MKKLIIKSILLSLVTLLFIKLGEKYFIKENRFNYANYKFNELNKVLEFDLIFFGSSKSYCAYNPAIFQNNLNVNTFNLAGQDQTLDVTSFVIEEALKKSKPKLIIVDVAESMFFIKESDSIFTNRKSLQFPTYDNYGLSFNKITHLKSIYKGERFFYATSPIIRNHGKWMDVFNCNYKKSYLEDKNNIFLSNNGYIGTLQYLSNSDLKEAEDLDQATNKLLKTENPKVGEKEIEILKNIKNIADKHDVDILFISTPTIRDYNTNLSFYEDLEQVFQDINTNYLNLYKEFDNILEPKDFKDIVHLNYTGGSKTSQHLAEYLKSNYDLTSTMASSNSSLNNNITYHLLSNLEHVNKIIDSSFEFNKEIKLNELGYFEEGDNRFVFLMKLEGNLFKENELDKYTGFVRYYKGEITEDNKNVNGFPLKVIDINKDKFIFARVLIDTSVISKFDVFFLDKETKKASKFLTIKDLKFIKNANL